MCNPINKTTIAKKLTHTSISLQKKNTVLNTIFQIYQYIILRKLSYDYLFDYNIVIYLYDLVFNIQNIFSWKCQFVAKKLNFEEKI